MYQTLHKKLHIRAFGSSLTKSNDAKMSKVMTFARAQIQPYNDVIRPWYKTRTQSPRSVRIDSCILQNRLPYTKLHSFFLCTVKTQDKRLYIEDVVSFKVRKKAASAEFTAKRAKE